MSEIISGKVWKFGDYINTDLMLPNIVNDGGSTLEEQARAVFSANRPGWVDEMKRGDFIVGGVAYGTGSNRPAARSLRTLGVGCLVAESINGLFFRNCVNFGMLALECPGVHAAFEEGHVAEVSFTDFTVRNRDTGKVLKAFPVPDHLLQLMQHGGIFPLLEKQGLVAPARKAG
jgi:3-isopropylmalate/(R)-2-methylmalate dehydratase small subunit